MQPAPKHDSRQGQFQDWVGDPQCELDIGIHGVWRITAAAAVSFTRFLAS